MGHDRKHGSRVLRFAVTGALLVAPLTTGCGDDEDDHIYINEPAPEPVVNNEPAENDGPQVPEPQVVEPTNNAPPETLPSPNTPAQPPSQ